jgi:hypothetical protein
MGEQIEKDHLEEKRIKKLNESNSASADTPNALNINSKNNLIEDSFGIMIKIKILLIQNVAILLGFFFMLLMANYSEHIKF